MASSDVIPRPMLRLQRRAEAAYAWPGDDLAYICVNSKHRKKLRSCRFMKKFANLAAEYVMKHITTFIALDVF